MPGGAGLQVAQYHQFHHLHERAGGRIPARCGLEQREFAGNFCGQRQRAVALDRWHRRERKRVLTERCLTLSKSEWKPGFAGRGRKHLPDRRDALHDDGRIGGKRSRWRQKHRRDDDGLAGDPGRRGRAGGHRSQRQRQLVRQQPGGSLHLSGHAAHGKHSRRVQPRPQLHNRSGRGYTSRFRCGCGRRCGQGRTEHGRGATLCSGGLSCGPARQRAVVDRNLPCMARAGQWRGLERGQRHQRHSRRHDRRK